MSRNLTLLLLLDFVFVYLKEYRISEYLGSRINFKLISDQFQKSPPLLFELSHHSFFRWDNLESYIHFFFLTFHLLGISSVFVLGEIFFLRNLRQRMVVKIDHTDSFISQSFHDQRNCNNLI